MTSKKRHLPPVMGPIWRRDVFEFAKIGIQPILHGASRSAVVDHLDIFIRQLVVSQESLQDPLPTRFIRQLLEFPRLTRRSCGCSRSFEERSTFSCARWLGHWTVKASVIQRLVQGWDKGEVFLGVLFGTITKVQIACRRFFLRDEIIRTMRSKLLLDTQSLEHGVRNND